MPARRLSTLLLPLCLGLPGAGWAAPDFQATVLSVGDGDTLRVRRREERITIRLVCIDSPVTAQSPCGQQARQALRWLLPIGLLVTIEPVSSDRYARSWPW